MIFGQHMGMGNEHEGIEVFGNLGRQVGVELAGEWTRFKEGKAMEGQVRRLILDLLGADQEFLMMAFEAGEPKSWLPEYEYRFIRFDGDLIAKDGETERLILLVCKGDRKGRTEYFGGLFGEKILVSGVDPVGVTLDGAVAGYTHIGRHKGIRGANGDALWRYLISPDDRGNELKTEFVRSYRDQVELIHQKLIGR